MSFSNTHIDAANTFLNLMDRTNAIIDFIANTTNLQGTAAGANGTVQLSNGSSTFVGNTFFTWGANGLVIASNSALGNTNLTGNLVCSEQIFFTANTEAIFGGFHYAEGNWTPTVSIANAGSSNIAPTFTATANGSFTHMGRSVFFTIYLDNTADGVKGNGAGQLSVSLPQLAGTAQIPGRILLGTLQNNTSEGLVLGSFTAGSNSLLLWSMTGISTIVPLTGADLNHLNTRQLSLQGKYLK